MKNILCLIGFVALISCKESTTYKKDSASEDKTIADVTVPTDSSNTVRDLKDIEDIQSEFAYVTSRIESSRMDSTSFNYNCNNEKNGTVVYFTEKGKLRMIKHSYNEYSHFSAVDHYFVKDSALFFVFQHRLAWSFVDQKQTKDEVTENRIYMIDNKPVKCLQKRYTIYSNMKDANKANSVANKEINCSSLKLPSENFELLLKYQERQKDLTCLEE